MKKTLLTLLLASILTVLFVSCSSEDGDNNNGTNPTSSCQVVLCWGEFDDSYWDYEADSSVYTDNIYVYGVVLNSTIPSISYVKLNGTTFSDDSYFSYASGYAAFGEEGDDIWVLTPSSTQISTEVSTSGGTVSGSLALPSVSGFPYEDDDTISKGAALPLNWTYTGGWCDFYYHVEYYDTLTEEWVDVYVDTFLTSNSYTIPASVLNHDCNLYISIYAVNGVYPTAGAAGNMTGTGSGFLYYENNSDDSHVYVNLIVGDGGYYSLDRPAPRPELSPEERLSRIAVKLGLEM